MDFSPLINQALNALWYLVPLALLAAIIKSPGFKGAFGEFQVNLLLGLFLPKDKYRVIKNVTLSTDTGTTQIDHIVVSKFGIFVIETKNMRGWIFGKEHQKQWTQKIFKYTNKFQNPLHQNYKHRKTLESNLNLALDCLYSVIVFIGESTFKTEMPDNVTYARGCVRYIKSKTVEHFTDTEVNNIFNAIESGRLERNLKTNREHVSHVKKIVESKSEQNKCPRCGSAMVVRVSKRGENVGNRFLGCSTFPKCRAVSNII